MTLVTWARIEPHARTTDLDAGLAAEVADPLWFLLRQLQLGELTGDDGGAPVAIDVSASWSRFSRYRAAGRDPAGDPVHVSVSDGPLEALVEHEPVIRPPDDPRGTPWTARVRAGRDLKRRLTAAGLDQVAARLAVHDDTTFTADAVADVVEGVDEARYRVMLTGRAIDGARTLALHQGAGLPAAVTAGVDRSHTETVLDAWAEALKTHWGVAPGAADTLSAAWVPDRLEYAFAVGAPPLPGGAGDLVLRAEEYDGTGLEWYSLDLDDSADATLGALHDADDDPTLVGSRVATLLPNPLSYPGMPSDRFWEMEDASVALGQVTGGPTDLARMLAVDFAVVYSPDWYLVPVELPLGCVARIDWVVVRDTFGVATLVGTTLSQSGDAAGRQFQPSSLSGDEGDHPLLVVVPSSLGGLTSEVREEVSLQRDEVADLVWSIERQVMGATGRGVARPWFRGDFALPAAQAPGGFELVWRLATPVAETWTPLVAVQGGGPRMLRKARILDTASTELRAAKSQVLADLQDVRQEEITAAGLLLRVTEQRARWYDGSTVVWRGRERRPARGEAASGLRFDAATPPEAPGPG